MERNVTKHGIRLFAPMLLCLAALAQACGQPSVETPSSSSPRAPKPAGTTSLNLTEGPGETVYAGSLVIWDDAIQGPKLSNLLDATRRYNSTIVDAERAFDAYLSTTIEPARRVVEEKKVAFDKARNGEKDVIDAKQVELAGKWAYGLIDTALSNAEGLDDAAKESLRAQAVGSFRKYCEAQIWRFALDKVVATGVFVRRPSPNALCEPFYAEAGLLQGGECASSPEGKNYHACVWNEGVRKTTFFARLAVATQAKVADVLGGETGRRYFAGEFGESATCVPGAATLNVLGMNGKVSCAQLGAEPIDFGMVQRDAAGVEKPLFPAMRDKSLDTATPARILGTWESPDPSQNQRVKDCDTKDMQDICPWKPQVTSGGAPVALPAGVRDTYLAAHPKLYAFSFPIGDCDQDFAMRTPNNAFFNAYKLRDLASFGACDKPADLSPYPAIIVTSDPNVTALRDEYETLRAKVAGNKGNFCKPSDNAVCKANPGANWGCLFAKYSDEKYTAATKVRNVSQVIYRDFRLTARRNADGTTALLMDLGNTGQGNIAGACVRPEDSKERISCGLPADLEGFGMKASYDAATGRLLVTIPIRSKRFAPETADATSLRDSIRIRRFEGKTLRIETYPSSLEGLHPYLSGKAVILDGTKEIAQGTASYLLDRRFEDRVAAFCNAKD